MSSYFLSLEWAEANKTPDEVQLTYDFIKNHLPTGLCKAHRPLEHVDPTSYRFVQLQCSWFLLH